MAFRHKRDTDARRTPGRTPGRINGRINGRLTGRLPRRPSRALLVAAPLAVAATATAVTVGVVTQPATRTVDAQDVSSDLSASVAKRLADTHLAEDRGVVSRSSSRLDHHMTDARMQRAYDASLSRTATHEAVRKADRHLWTTAPLNLWTGPGKDAEQVGLLEERSRVLVTGRRQAGRAEVVVDKHTARWVTASYLAVEKPVVEKPEPARSTDHSSDEGSDEGSGQRSTTAAAPSTGLSTAPCPDSSVESGLTSEAVSVYRAVCNAFPQITTYGGWDDHGEHASGRAIDIMTSDKALGDQIAGFLQSHASELHLYDVIWWDRIWTPARASEGWRDYGDHGSATANHMDHVHVATTG